MNLITHQPSQKLKNVIRKMWIIEQVPVPKISVNAFPTGYAFINIIQGSPFKINGSNSSKFSTHCYIAGQGCGHFNLQMQNIKRAITIQLQPYAIPSLLNIPAQELFDLQLDLYQIHEEMASRLESAINSAQSGQAILNQVDYILASYLSDQDFDPRVIHGLKLILRDQGNLGLKALYESLNISQRRGQQLFKYYLGMTAKSFCRVVKMQFHSFELLMGKDMDMVVPDGYFDQSHFIHELKKQTGMLPGEYEHYIASPDKKAAYLSSNLFYDL